MKYTISTDDAARAREAILGLWRRNLPDARPDRYAWLYEAGPARGFVLQAEQGPVVGAAGRLPRDFSAFGVSRKAAQAIDLNVDRDHRTIGPALRLQRAVLAASGSDDVILAYGFPNSQSEAVFRHVGYRTLSDLQRWVKPLSMSVAFDYLRWPRWLARSSAALIDPFFPRKLSEVVYRCPRTMHICRGEAFDARFDRLWESARSRFAVLGERTAAYLTWRFSQCPIQRYRTFCLIEPSGELAAYLVYGVRDETAYVADLLFAGEEHFAPLVAEFIRFSRRERVRKIVLLYAGRAAVGKTLARLGFRRRPSGRKAVVFLHDRGIEPSEQAAFLNPENWHLTGADIDTNG